MQIGDQLLLQLTTSEQPCNLYRIMNVICEFVEDTNTYPIKRLMGYLLGTSCSIRRPPGCVQVVYKGTPYWRDGWNNLYSNRTCRKVGIFYPQTGWASICLLYTSPSPRD